MQNAQTIYQQTVLPLPDSEKLRLATIILQHLSNSEKKSQSAFDLLQEVQGEKVFSTAQEVDEHLKTERESWDN
ncbi:MAG: hypothetical protein K1X72_22735 [Pyrinomonadaceae bacterium]|nr:hypothetical protein [Pyrinomonadaceae bacterium]